MTRTGAAKPMKAIRNAAVALTLKLTGVIAMTDPSLAQTQAP